MPATLCVICGKEKSTLRCSGCFNEFCYKHWESHRQELSQQFDEIEVDRDLFRQSLDQQFEQRNNENLIQKINQWERKSIKIIQHTAEQARGAVLENSKEYIHQMEMKLDQLTNQLRQGRREDDFNELHLQQFQEELKRLRKDLMKPANIDIRENPTSFIHQIWVDVSSRSTWKLAIPYDTSWIQNGVTILGGKRKGKELNQLSRPSSIYVDDDDQTIYIADCENHRILEWKQGATVSEVVAGGKGPGNQTNQLNYPSDMVVDKERNNLIICDYGNRRVVRWPRRNGTHGQIIISDIDCCRLTIDDNGHVYVSDYKKHEVRRWKIGDTIGVLVAGGNRQGNGLNQLDFPTCLFVDPDLSIYISDRQNHRVMKWMEGATEGIVVAGGEVSKHNLTQLLCPQGVIVDHLGTVYVVDADHHRILRWYKDTTQGNIIVGGNAKGEQANQLCHPRGLSFDSQGNLYVVDSGNDRIQKFQIDRS